MHWILATGLGIALVGSAVIDLRSQRIPNPITYALILFGLGIHAMTGGTDGFLFGAKGAGVGFGLLLVPYMLGVMGGGDVKLMAGVGACLGIQGVILAMVLGSLAGGVYALILLVTRKGLLRRTFQPLGRALVCFASTGRFEYQPSFADGAAPKLCYGVALAAGTLAAMALGPMLGAAMAPPVP
jgi:prepilin peptidase CpaA